MTGPDRWNAKQPDRMESHRVHLQVTSPLCALQELDPKDFVRTMGDALNEEEQRNSLHTDQRTVRLNDVFVRAHGLPQGEYTIFSSGMETSNLQPGMRSR